METTGPVGSAPSEAAFEWEEALWETIRHLQTAIRLDTVNPPGRELALARYLDDVLRGEGIATTLLQPAPDRGALVARIPGTGARRPLLLMAHLDVVGVERDKWSENPFGGELRDGYLYGRGAIDDKGMLATNLEAMLLLQRWVRKGGPPPARDVVFVATADEEAGGNCGMAWLVAEHGGLLDAEFAFNEGGRLRMDGGVLTYCAVQCAEKVPNVLRVTAYGPSGHASVPLAGNAVARLARAVAAIDAHREQVVLLDVSRGFFSGLATVWRDRRERAAMLDLVSGDPARTAAGAAVLSEEPFFNAVLRNGISPTMLEGGVRANVIPAEASATLSVRTLPGEALDALVDRLRVGIKDANVEVRVVTRGVDAPSSPAGSVMFDAIRDAVSALAPGVPTLPYLSTGATDSAWLRRIGVQTYGLLPFPLVPEDERRMHGHDERVPVASLEFGMRLTWEIVRRVALPAPGVA